MIKLSESLNNLPVKLKILFIFILTISFFAVILFFVSDEGFVFLNKQFLKGEILPERIINATGSTLAVLQNDWKLIEKIEEAKNLLSNPPALSFTEDKNRLIRKEIALAILDTQTGIVLEKRYWLDQNDIDKADLTRKNYLENSENLPRFQPKDVYEEYSVITNWWNSFNSDWSIVKNGTVNDRYVVVADKYLISNESLAYPEDRTGKKYSDIVYVPYSKTLKDKTLITAGKKFLNDHVSDAFNEMTSFKIRSKAFPGRLVVDTITQTFVKNIFLTEQTDPKMMLLSTDGGLELAERVLIRLGANGEKAFRYTVSKTGASGLGQIMPGTYNSIQNGYPDARLIKDVDIGRVDIKNAIKASTLVFDDHLAIVVKKTGVSKKSKLLFEEKTQDEVDEIMAAIYNGGPSKYLHLTGNISNAVKETVFFLRKFRMLKDLGLFDQYVEI